MLWLSGAWRPEWPPEPGMGVMLTPAGAHGLSTETRPRLLAAMPWAADTGMFSAPERFVLSRYLAWLRAHRLHQGTCLFATAPDAVGDWARTWEMARPVLPLLREAGYKAALIAQDGMEELPAPGEWDVLFVGGTTPFKLGETAYRLVREAKGLGKWTHMGRANSIRRWRAAKAGGYDSADGTKLRFQPDKEFPKVRGWIRDLAMQPGLPLWG